MKTIGLIGGMSWVGLLVKQEGSQIPLFDTTVIHSVAAVDYALSLSPPQAVSSKTI